MKFGTGSSTPIDLEKAPPDSLSQQSGIHTDGGSNREFASLTTNHASENTDDRGDRCEYADTNSFANGGGIGDEPPPNGGLTAWTQAAMGHLVIFNTWGFVNSFGVFQAYYAGALNRPPSDISWIGSLQIFLLFAVGAFSGRALDAGLFQTIYLSGYLIHVIGIFMTSLGKEYWQVILSQGICVGIGNGLLFCPTISLVSTYFTTKKALAMGIAAAGSATGGMIYPVLVQQLLPKIGFGWTVRLLGFVTLATGGLAGALLKSRVTPRKSGPLVEWEAFKEAPYVLYCVAMFLNFMGLYYAFYYIGAFGRDILGMSYSKSINLILIVNGVGYIGRIVPNILADRYIGALNAIIPCAFGAGILLFGWSGVHNERGLIGFCVIYGLVSSGVQSMFAVTLSSLTTDLSKVGTRMGMCFTIVSFGTLIGPPIAGALIQADGGQYKYAQLWGGAVVVTSAIILAAARIAKTGFVLKAVT